MRARYPEISEAGAVVLAIAPSPVEEVRAAVRELQLSFPCLADPDRTVFRLYSVGSSPWSLGQRPAVFLIGPDGAMRKAWRGRQQWEIPSVDEILAAVKAAVPTQYPPSRR